MKIKPTINIKNNSNKNITANKAKLTFSSENYRIEQDKKIDESSPEYQEMMKKAQKLAEAERKRVSITLGLEPSPVKNSLFGWYEGELPELENGEFFQVDYTNPKKPKLLICKFEDGQIVLSNRIILGEPKGVPENVMAHYKR